MVKPVAWISESEFAHADTGGEHMLVKVRRAENYTIPLYTAPRELSDDEIMELAEYHGINDWLYETSVTDFARAILKKASE
jgi:hypothetical protein